MEKTTANCIPKQAHGYTESWERLLPVAREQRVPPPCILASEHHSEKKEKSATQRVKPICRLCGQKNCPEDPGQLVAKFMKSITFFFPASLFFGNSKG